jgi:hypothetical protein
MQKAGGGDAAGHGFQAAGELALRLIGAALQVIATVVVVRSLAPPAAGVYFEGFVIAFALASLLRGKYEMLILRHILGDGAHISSIAVIELLAALGKRVAFRCVLVAGVLLVLTADLDIMEPRLQAFLETFLPFVLAMPFLAVALFLSTALRAAQRSLGSTLIGAYSINIAIIAAGALSSPDQAFSLLSWAFFAGSVAASAVGVLLVRKVFPKEDGAARPCLADWRYIYNSAAFDYGIAGLALSGLQWGPLCVLALAGPSIQIAAIAVTLRLALVVELMMPALVFVPLSLNVALRLVQTLRTERRRLAANLVLSALAASGLTLVLMIFMPRLLSQMGEPYTGLTGLFTLLLAAQWVNASARPALRFMTQHHYKPVQWALCLSALMAVGVSLLGVSDYGAVAAAAGALLGTLLLNLHSLVAALKRPPSSTSTHTGSG